MIGNARRLAEQHAVLTQERRAGMFHTAVWKSRNEHLIVLRKRIRLIEERAELLHSLMRIPRHLRPFLLRLLDHRPPHEQPQRRPGRARLRISQWFKWPR